MRNLPVPILCPRCSNVVATTDGVDVREISLGMVVQNEEDTGTYKITCDCSKEFQYRPVGCRD